MQFLGEKTKFLKHELLFKTKNFEAHLLKAQLCC
jgi:hypothetical protein